MRTIRSPNFEVRTNDPVTTVSHEVVTRRRIVMCKEETRATFQGQFDQWRKAWSDMAKNPSSWSEIVL